MNTKHTNGPWVIDSGSCFEPENQPKRGFAVASAELAFSTVTIRAGEQDRCPTTKELNEIGIANAHLIAAAPELLEALEEVVCISDRKHDAWDKAKTAIAKAKGEIK